MSKLQVTRTYTFQGVEKSHSNIWQAGRVGQGTEIHFVGNGNTAICGTGNNGMGMKRRASVKKLDKPHTDVTCKKCLSKWQEAQEEPTSRVEVIS